MNKIKLYVIVQLTHTSISQKLKKNKNTPKNYSVFPLYKEQIHMKLYMLLEVVRLFTLGGGECE